MWPGSFYVEYWTSNAKYSFKLTLSIQAFKIEQKFIQKSGNFTLVMVRLPALPYAKIPDQIFKFVFVIQWLYSETSDSRMLHKQSLTGELHWSWFVLFCCFFSVFQTWQDIWHATEIDWKEILDLKIRSHLLSPKEKIIGICACLNIPSSSIFK